MNFKLSDIKSGDIITEQQWRDLEEELIHSGFRISQKPNFEKDLCEVNICSIVPTNKSCIYINTQNPEYGIEKIVNLKLYYKF